MMLRLSMVILTNKKGPRSYMEHITTDLAAPSYVSERLCM